MNPNTCTICEMMFTKVMKARQVTIDATVLFADLRGYTSLSQSRSARAISEVLDAFYDESAECDLESRWVAQQDYGRRDNGHFQFSDPPK